MGVLFYSFKNYLTKFEQIMLYVFVLFYVNLLAYFSLWLLNFFVCGNFLCAIILAFLIYKISRQAISIVVDVLFVKTLEKYIIMQNSKDNN